MVIITSWIKATIAARLNCHSNLIQIYINIAAKDKLIASNPSLSNSLLTLGPTFSTLLKFITPPKSFDSLSLIDFVKFGSSIFDLSIFTK